MSQTRDVLPEKTVAIVSVKFQLSLFPCSLSSKGTCAACRASTLDLGYRYIPLSKEYPFCLDHVDILCAIQHARGVGFEDS